MSARDQMAQMLNELMGPNRNEEMNRSMLNFRDDDVCRNFLAGFCPHDEFVNTKADLGPCRRIHDENLRIAYRNSEFFERLGYERQYYHFLVGIYEDVRRKIERNKERLALTQGTIDETTKNQLTERALQMEREIAAAIVQAEEAGAAGELELSQQCVKRAEDLKVELDSVRKTIDNPQTNRVVNDPNAPKPMRICEVCGCFLIIGDVQQRIEDHLNGKQHLGYAKISSTIEELKAKLKHGDRDLTPERTGRGGRASRSPPRHRRDHRSRSPLRGDGGGDRRSDRKERDRRRSRSSERDGRGSRHNGGSEKSDRHGSRGGGGKKEKDNEKGRGHRRD